MNFFKEKDKFTFKECQQRGLKIYQCPTFQFLVVALVVLTIVSIIASKIILTDKSVILILLIFSLILSFAGWLIVRNYKKRTSNFYHV